MQPEHINSSGTFFTNEHFIFLHTSFGLRQVQQIRCFRIFFHLSLGQSAKNCVHAVTSCLWLSRGHGNWRPGMYHCFCCDVLLLVLTPAACVLLDSWVQFSSSFSEPLSQLNWAPWVALTSFGFKDALSGSSPVRLRCWPPSHSVRWCRSP